MATFSRISAGGAWVQGDDGAASSRVTFGGWIQINLSGGTSVTVTPSAQTLTLTHQSVTVSGEANVPISAQSLLAALQSPTVSGNASVSVTAQSISLSQNAPTVSTSSGGSLTVNVPALGMSLAIYSPVVGGDGVVSPTLLQVISTLNSPTIFIAGDVDTPARIHELKIYNNKITRLRIFQGRTSALNVAVEVSKKLFVGPGG